MSTSSFEKAPSVVAKPRMINSPETNAAIDGIKQGIAERGYVGVVEFKFLAEEQKLDEGELLLKLEEEGITFTKTSAIDSKLPTEVLVDMRYMAAAMMLIYSDRTFAKNHSVLKYLKMLFKISEWDAAFPLANVNPLLEDMYSDLGHNFTVMAVAEKADLSNEDESVIHKRAERYKHPMRELVKSDAELTAVYQLALRVMHIVNGRIINGRPGQRGDLTHRTFNEPKAYNVFWTTAQKILDLHFVKK